MYNSYRPKYRPSELIHFLPSSDLLLAFCRRFEFSKTFLSAVCNLQYFGCILSKLRLNAVFGLRDMCAVYKPIVNTANHGTIGMR